MLPVKILKKSIGSIEHFIQSSQNKYRRSFNHLNTAKFNKVQTEQTTHHAQNSQPGQLNIQRNEIETRILRILDESGYADLNEFQFNQDLRKDCNLDELAITDLISSVEEQFCTVFDLKVYEGVSTMMDLVHLLEQDQKVI